ncbi:MAG: tetratricopeptide repeat protein [Chlamydiae bacterium]|nr:tetratricopeptide repeat protein [Chlamydiota bacterium]
MLILFLTLTGCGHPPDGSSQDYDQKIKKIQRDLEKDYKNPRIHTNLGVLYEKKGILDQAEKHYRVAIEIDPQFTEACINLTNLYITQKDYPGALQTLQKALEENPNDPHLDYLLATVLRETKQYLEALTQYEKVLKLDPKNTLAQNYMGVIFYELKEYSKSESSFQKTIALDPNFADAYGNLAFLYDFSFHDKKKAIEYYEKFLNLKSEGPNVALAQDLLKKAKEEINRPLPLSETPEREDKESREIKKENTAKEVKAQPKPSPEEPQTHVPEAKSETNEANPPQKKSPPPIVIVKTPLLTPSMPSPAPQNQVSPVDSPPTPKTQSSLNAKNEAAHHFSLGSSFQAKGKNAEAIAEYEKVLRLNRSHMKAHYNLGILYKWKGESEKAAREYLEVIRLDPNFAKAYYNLGIILKTQGKWDEAILKFKSAIQIDIRYSDAYLGVALVYSQNKKDIQRSIPYYKKYLLLSPSSPTAVKIKGWLHSIGEDG